MLLASLALVAAVIAATAAVGAVREQRRLERALAAIRRGDLFRSTAYAEADRASAWLATVTDPITRPITRPIADATQTVAGSVAGAFARLLPFTSRHGRRLLHGELISSRSDSLILAELGRSVDEAVFERRQLTADLSQDETIALRLVDDEA